MAISDVILLLGGCNHGGKLARDRVPQLLVLQVHPMKQSMYPWGQNDPAYSDEYETAEECVERREQLGRCRFHAVYRTHAAQDHRSIQKRIDPIQRSGRVVAM